MAPDGANESLQIYVLRCELLRMSFDIKNFSETLVRGIREVLLGMAGVERRVIDDLMVFSSNWMTHLETLEELLRRSSKVNLTARLWKCIFGASSVAFWDMMSDIIGSRRMTIIWTKLHVQGG